MDRIIEKIELLENECNDTAHIDQNTLENYGLTGGFERLFTQSQTRALISESDSILRLV